MLFQFVSRAERKSISKSCPTSFSRRWWSKAVTTSNLVNNSSEPVMIHDSWTATRDCLKRGAGLTRISAETDLGIAQASVSKGYDWMFAAIQNSLINQAMQLCDNQAYIFREDLSQKKTLRLPVSICLFPVLFIALNHRDHLDRPLLCSYRNHPEKNVFVLTGEWQAGFHK